MERYRDRKDITILCVVWKLDRQKKLQKQRQTEIQSFILRERDSEREIHRE